MTVSSVLSVAGRTISKLRVQMACDRLLWAFMLVLAVVRQRAPRSSSLCRLSALLICGDFWRGRGAGREQGAKGGRWGEHESVSGSWFWQSGGLFLGDLSYGRLAPMS